MGTVISDYNGSYGYQLSDAAVRAGNDLMLGYGMAESNQFTDTEAATCVLPCARPARYPVHRGNSGYYAGEAARRESGNKMTAMFASVDAAVIIAALAIEAVVLCGG